jgi:hypothetical protein
VISQGDDQSESDVVVKEINDASSVFVSLDRAVIHDIVSLFEHLHDEVVEVDSLTENFLDFEMVEIETLMELTDEISDFSIAKLGFNEVFCYDHTGSMGSNSFVEKKLGKSLDPSVIGILLFNRPIIEKNLSKSVH